MSIDSQPPVTPVSEQLRVADQARAVERHHRLHLSRRGKQFLGALTTATVLIGGALVAVHEMGGHDDPGIATVNSSVPFDRHVEASPLDMNNPESIYNHSEATLDTRTIIPYNQAITPAERSRWTTLAKTYANAKAANPSATLADAGLSPDDAKFLADPRLHDRSVTEAARTESYIRDNNGIFYGSLRTMSGIGINIFQEAGGKGAGGELEIDPRKIDALVQTSLLRLAELPDQQEVPPAKLAALANRARRGELTDVTLSIVLTNNQSECIVANGDQPDTFAVPVDGRECRAVGIAVDSDNAEAATSTTKRNPLIMLSRLTQYGLSATPAAKVDYSAEQMALAINLGHELGHTGISLADTPLTDRQAHNPEGATDLFEYEHTRLVRPLAGQIERLFEAGPDGRPGPGQFLTGIGYRPDPPSIPGPMPIPGPESQGIGDAASVSR